jgi:Rod binding domain-containing protein
MNGPDTVSMKIEPRDYRRVEDKYTNMQEVARDFESLLIGQFFKLMHSTITDRGVVGKSFQRNIYEEMLQTEFARAFSRRGGFGLHQEVVESFRFSGDNSTGRDEGSKKKVEGYKKIIDGSSSEVHPNGSSSRLDIKELKSNKISPTGKINYTGVGESED